MMDQVQAQQDKLMDQVQTLQEAVLSLQDKVTPVATLEGSHTAVGNLVEDPFEILNSFGFKATTVDEVSK